jgi:hypothetical protein
LALVRPVPSAACWLTAAALFVGFQLVDIAHQRIWRVEIGYFGATAVLCALLWLLYRRGGAGNAVTAARSRTGESARAGRPRQLQVRRDRIV